MELPMRISLKNVGIIKDSSIVIDGITVITGKNNSGKSTLGKAVYSLLSSSEDLFNNATEDISQFAESLLTNRFRANDLHLICRGSFISHRDNEDLFDDYIYQYLCDIYNQQYPIFNSLEMLKSHIASIVTAIGNIDENYIKEKCEHNKLLNDRFFSIIPKIDELKQNYINDCEEIIEIINKYSDFVEYEQKKVLYTLLFEFNNQLSPVRINEKLVSEFVIDINERKYTFRVVERDHYYMDEGELFFNEQNNVIFIDDVTVIDGICPGFSERKRRSESETLESYIHCYDHKSALIKKISRKGSLVESILDDENFQKIERIINTVISDDIMVEDGRFVCSSDKLDLANLAMGSKLFVILKMLLKNGSINKGTILILDEPEAHLHPEWQNILAEIISVLVKEIGIKVIITSHSPNFVLAIQTYSSKYSLSKVTNYYKTNKIDEYLVEYKNVNENLNSVYSDFALYFSNMKALYDSLNDGEKND